MGLQDGDMGEYDQIIIYKTQGINKKYFKCFCFKMTNFQLSR